MDAAGDCQDDSTIGDRAAGATATVGTLVGFTLAWLIAAMTVRMGGVFPKVPYSDTVVLATCFSAMVLGVRLPRRLALGVASLAWKRNDGPPPDDPLNPPHPDPALLWALTAAAAMAAGLSVAVLGLLARGVEGVLQYAERHFLWIPPAYAVLVTLLVAALVLVPMTLVGIVLSCLHQFDGSDKRGALPRAPWLLTGASGGLLAVQSLTHGDVKPDLPVVLAAVPLLVAAIFAVQQTKRTAENAPPRDDFPENALARDIALLRSVTSLSAIATVGSIVLWERLIPTWSGSTVDANATLSCLLASAAVGAITGARRPFPGTELTLRLARRVAIAGVFTIAAVAGFSLRPDHFGDLAMFGYWPVACASVVLIVSAQTFAYRCAWSCDHGGASGSLLAECLAATVLVICVIALIAPGAAGECGLLIGIGLSLSAVGASVVLQEPGRSFVTRIAHATVVLVVSVGIAASLPRRADLGAADRPATRFDARPSPLAGDLLSSGSPSGAG